MYEIDKDFVWERMSDHFKRREAAVKAWLTREQNLIAERNTQVSPPPWAATSKVSLLAYAPLRWLHP